MYTEAVEARGKRGRWMAWCDFKGYGEGGYFVCEGVVWSCARGAPWIGLMLISLMSFLRMMSMVLVLRGVGPTLGNGYGI